MLGRFLKALFLIGLPVLLIINLAYTFNAVSLINPTSENINYSDYYYGLSSIIDDFKTFGSQNEFLSGFHNFLRSYSENIQEVYKIFKDPIIGSLASVTGNGWLTVLSAIISIVKMFMAFWPMIMMFFYTIVIVVYVICLALTIVAFLMKLMGGYSRIPLPNPYNL